MSLQIIPALDLINGKAVSLYKGKFEQAVVADQAPWNIAEGYTKQGADKIVIIDLDGARRDTPVNLRTIEKICNHTDLPLTVGGGIRTLSAAKTVFETGASQIIVGTSAVIDGNFLSELLEEYGSDKIVVGLSARETGAKITVGSENKKTEIDTLDFAEDLVGKGVTRVLFTDIARSGTLTFPNFDIAERLANSTRLKVWLRGGIAKPQQVRLIAESVGAEAAVIGRALLVHELSLSELKSN